jgi:hypothetical protein
MKPDVCKIDSYVARDSVLYLPEILSNETWKPTLLFIPIKLGPLATVNPLYYGSIKVRSEHSL